MTRQTLIKQSINVIQMFCDYWVPTQCYSNPARQYIAILRNLDEPVTYIAFIGW